MNKTDLEVKIESLRNMVLESQQQTSNYTGQLATTEKQLKDYNKIALPPMVFDEIHEAVERAVDNIDFSDTSNYNVDFSIDYDNRVYIENLELTHSTDLVQEIVENISELFTEMDCPEEITEAQKADEACN